MAVLPFRNPQPQDDLEGLFRRESEGLGRYVSRILGNYDGTADVVQESFLRFCSMGSRVVEGTGRALLFRLARNLAIDRVRERCRVTQFGGDVIEIPVSTTPEDLLLRKERTRLLHSALSALSERDRELLALRHAGLSYREIAEILNLNQHSVGQLLARALRRFREKYVELGQSQVDTTRSSQRR